MSMIVVHNITGKFYIGTDQLIIVRVNPKFVNSLICIKFLSDPYLKSSRFLLTKSIMIIQRNKKLRQKLTVNRNPNISLQVKSLMVTFFYDMNLVNC